MSMHTTQEWHHNAQFNMTQASNTQRSANKQIDTSRRAHQATVDDNLGAYNELHASLEIKVKTSYRLIDKLQKRSDSLDTSIQQTRQTLAMLEATFRAKEAPLQLCAWRMEQREKRPLREQVRDNVEVALEDEKRTLCDTQRKLMDAIKRAKNMIHALEGKLEEVRQDLEQKNQALGVDEMCLRTTHRSFQTVVDRTPGSRATAGPGSGRLPADGRMRGTLPQQIAVHESSKNEVHRQNETVRLTNSAAGREDVAKELREECAKIAARCDRSVEEATSKTERWLQERVNENQTMRRRLEGEIRETHQKGDHTKQTINETRQQMKALEEPIELTSTCASWRKQRATREHIHDPVSTKLSEHQNLLLRSHEGLRSHHQCEKQILQQLTERREHLKEDLRDKTSALHIDLNCLTHESCQQHGRSTRILGKSKLTKALKVDPSFVPMSTGQTAGGNFATGSIPYGVSHGASARLPYGVSHGASPRRMPYTAR